MARHRATSQGDVPLTEAQNAQRDIDEAAHADWMTNVFPLKKWEEDRRKAYGDIGAQLDMQYWDGVNDTTVWVDHVAAVKAALPKPE